MRALARSAVAPTIQLLAAASLLLVCLAAAPEAAAAQEICVESTGGGTAEGNGVNSLSACPGDRTAAVVSTAPSNGDHLQPGLCAVDCFEVTAAYSTPAYVSLDQERAATLVYRGGQARPRPLVQVDVRDTSNVQPTKLSIRLLTPSGTAVTFTTGLQEIFYTYTPAPSNRLSAQFNAGALPTRAYDYTVAVRSWWADGTVRESTAPIRVLVVNEVSSPYGAGWSVAGLQRALVQANGSVMITDGAGGAAYFHKPCSTCAFTTPPGDFTTLTFDGTHYKRRFQDGTELFFLSNGRLSHVRDRLGHQNTYAYHANGTLNYIADPLGQQTVFGYDASGRLASIKDPGGRYSYFSVNAAGDLTQITDPSNTVVLQAAYDSQHRITARTDAAGGTAKHAYDSFGKLAADSLPAVQLWNGLTARPTIRYRSLEAASLPASGGTSAAPAPGVDPTAIRVSVTNPRGHATQMAVDRWGAPTRVEAPLGQVELAWRDSEGRDTLAVTALGDTLRYRWSGPNLTRAASAIEGTISFWTYEPAFGQVREESGDQTYRRFFYSVLGLVDSVKVGSATAPATRFAYDAYGRVMEQTDPEGHKTLYNYASTGARNLESITTVDLTTLPGGLNPGDELLNDTITRVAYVYDQYGRARVTHNALGDSTRTEYDRVNRVTRTIGPRGDAAVYGYNGLGLATVTDALNQTYTYQRNALGWVTGEVDPGNRTETFRFDENGNVRAYVNRRGQIATWEYDAMDRRTQQVADGKTTLTSYPQSTGWVVVQSPVSTDSLRIDPLGRTAESITRRGALRYRTTAGYLSGGESVDLFMDSPGRYMSYRANGGLLTSMTDLAGGTTSPGYNADRQATGLQLPSGMHISRTFGGEHRPSRITYTPQMDTLGLMYAYDVMGRLRQKLPAGGTQPSYYNYDGSGQLTQVVRAGTAIESFAYDLVGNPTDQGAVVTAGNRLTSFRGFTLQYDADGNLTQKLGNGVDQRYYWSTLSQLDSVQLNGAMYRYLYDGLGRRVQKNNPWDGAIDFTYWLDGETLLQERLNATGEVMREYTYYPGVDRPHSVRNATGVYYYMTDEQGNVIGMFNAQNQVVNRYSYSSFGELTGRATSVGNPLRFAAREHDQETGLYYNRARYYDPQLRRFISEDPIGLGGGINPYAYAHNNPVNLRDPSGLIPCSPYWVKVGGVVDEWLLMNSDGCMAGEYPVWQGGGWGDSGPGRGARGGGSRGADPATQLLIYNYAQGLENLAECTVEQYKDLAALTLRAVSWGGALPVAKRSVNAVVIPLASENTTVLNLVGRRIFGPMRVPGRTWAGRTLTRVFGTNKITTIVNRANVVFARGLVAYDAISIFGCAASK